MALIKDAIFSRLSNFAGLSALVSTRITPGKVPQNETMPAVLYWRVDEDRPSAMGVDAGIVFAVFQFNCYDTLPDGAEAVGEQVRLALQRWRGTEAGVVIQDSFIETRSDQHLARAGKAGLERVIVEARIIYEE